MKPLIILSLILCFAGAAQAQTKTAIVEKNIKECFKHSAKTPADFDWCVADEFRRVKEEKEYREARIAVGKDPDAGCGKKGAYKDCFDEIMSDLGRTSVSLYDGSGSDVDYLYISPRWLRYRYLYPYRYRYPSRFRFTYPRPMFRRTYRYW